VKVIVFGGSGFLGSHVADALSNSGHDVTIFDQHQSVYLRYGQKMIIGNILNLHDVHNAVVGCEVVYNFAGIADLDDSTTKPIETVRLNIEGNVNVLDAAVKAGVKRFVYASSVYVYSNKGGFYRCSKQASEIYVEEFNAKYGLAFNILRYGTLYGPRATEKNSIIRYLSQALKEGKITVPGDGEEVREYIHVRDAAKLSVDILSETYKNQHIIITGHQAVKFKYLLTMIKEIMDNSVDICFEPVSNMSHYYVTPYNYMPKIGKKLTTNCYTDMGQGLLECLSEIDPEYLDAPERG
jgi:UDP-glucose 4-epimerase